MALDAARPGAGLQSAWEFAIVLPLVVVGVIAVCLVRTVRSWSNLVPRIAAPSAAAAQRDPQSSE